MKLLQSNFEDVISRHSMGLSPHLIHILHYLTIKCEDCPPWKPMPTASCACGVVQSQGTFVQKAGIWDTATKIMTGVVKAA